MGLNSESDRLEVFVAKAEIARLKARIAEAQSELLTIYMVGYSAGVAKEREACARAKEMGK